MVKFDTLELYVTGYAKRDHMQFTMNSELLPLFTVAEILLSFLKVLA